MPVEKYQSFTHFNSRFIQGIYLYTMISESETLILTSAFFTLVLNMWHTCQVRFIQRQ